MDRETIDFLISNELEEYCDCFRENQISRNELYDLTQDLIAELIKPIGHRVKFSKALPAAANFKVTLFNESSNAGSTTVSECSIQEVRVVLDLLPHVSDTDSTDQGYSLMNLDSQDIIFEESDEGYPAKRLKLNNSENRDTGTTSCESATSYRENTSATEIGCSQKTDTSTSKPLLQTQQDLETLLKSCASGQQVLSIFERDGKLNQSARDKLTTAIVTKLIAHYGTGLKNFQFAEAASLIKQLFPSETVETYYIPPYSKGKDQQISKGKLPFKHRNLKTAMKKSGLTLDRKTSQPKSVSSAEIVSLPLPDNDFIEAKTWLTHYAEPWTKVPSLWNETSSTRVSQLHSGANMTINDIFKEWPLYKHPLGFTLICSDFKTLYSDKDLAFLTKWQTSREKLLDIMTARLSTERGQSFKILKNIQSAESDRKDAVLLHMLPALLPSTVIRRKGKDTWKPTIIESQEGFVLHVKTPGDIKIQLDKKTQKMNKLGCTVQPLVILQGDSLLNIQQSYVSVNEQLYKVEDPLSAVHGEKRCDYSNSC